MCGNNLHKFLRSIILVISVLIISALILLAALVIKRKSVSANKQVPTSQKNLPITFKTLNIKELSFPVNCNPLDTLFKENYIAIYSNKCGIVKIITLH